jgi:hypothetical protein
VSHYLSHMSSRFWFGYFVDRDSCFLPGVSLRLWSSYLCFLYNWDYRQVLPQLAAMPSESPIAIGVILPHCSPWGLDAALAGCLAYRMLSMPISCFLLLLPHWR